MADWVEVGADNMTSAQKALGLSDERAARLVPVSVRTWIRWRQSGKVPAHSVEKVATILGLEIERPATRTISIPDAVGAEELDALTQTLHRVEKKIDAMSRESGRRLSAIERELGRLSPRLPA